MPRPIHPPLTDPRVRALVARRTPVDVRDGETRGLILTVLPSGRKQFAVRYRMRGKQRRLVLGDYPGLTLAKARKRARQAQTELDAGRDLLDEQQARKQAKTDTVEALAADYIGKHARKFKRTADEDQRMLDVDVLPKWRTRSVRELTRRDIRALVERIAERAPVMANRVLALVRKMLNFAVEHDWIDANPAAHIQKPTRETSRERVLTDEEIRRVWRLLSNLPRTADRAAPGRKRSTGTDHDPLCPVHARFAALMKVRLLTAQRGGETARMRWGHVDVEAGWWTIPSSDSKNGEPHRVPLVDDAITIITALQPDKDEREPDAYVFLRGQTLVRAKNAPAVIARKLGIDFRGHDFRRTAATRMAAAGIPRDHISRVLNHVEGGARATAVYDRYSYDREKRIALETWARAVQAIVQQKDGGTTALWSSQDLVERSQSI